jgi:CubicO group peptidase (beta-lactamase class C family)
MTTQHNSAADAAPAEVHDYITALMRERSIPGLSIAVTNRDRLLFAGGYGQAVLDPATPATPSTSYLWFSMSKLVTTTAAMHLAEEGGLDLDAPCGEYLGQRPVGSATVRQLLSHTAGTANPIPLRWVHPAASPARDDELLDRLLDKHAKPKHEVGAAARYSNLGYLILGRVISVGAGVPFTDYVHEAVLRPAGMSDTGYGIPSEGVAATGHVKCPRGTGLALKAVLPPGIVGPRHDNQLTLRPFLVDGAAYGGLVGHVIDAARFARLHLRDGEMDGARVLSPAGARQMRDLRYPGKPFDHGLAWFRKPDADRSKPFHVEHYGAGAGFWNAMRLYPDLGLGMVIMANTTAAYDVDALFDLLRKQPW